jgi:hypothetical protein
MRSCRSELFRIAAALCAAVFAGPAFAHEGHGNTALHAFLHLLQEPDHLIMLAVAALAAVAVLGAWWFFKGQKK